MEWDALEEWMLNGRIRSWLGTEEVLEWERPPILTIEEFIDEVLGGTAYEQ